MSVFSNPSTTSSVWTECRWGGSCLPEKAVRIIRKISVFVVYNSVLLGFNKPSRVWDGVAVFFEFLNIRSFYQKGPFADPFFFASTDRLQIYLKIKNFLLFSICYTRWYYVSSSVSAQSSTSRLLHCTAFAWPLISSSSVPVLCRAKRATCNHISWPHTSTMLSSIFLDLQRPRNLGCSGVKKLSMIIRAAG